MARNRATFLKGMLKNAVRGVGEAPRILWVVITETKSRSVLFASGECEGHLMILNFFSFFLAEVSGKRESNGEKGGEKG